MAARCRKRCKEGMKMNTKRKTLKMPVRYLMNAVLVEMMEETEG